MAGGNQVKLPPWAPSVIRSRLYLSSWMTAERQYADAKYPDKSALEAHLHSSGISDTSWYYNFIGNYIRRAQLFTLSTPHGRQAFGKAIITMMDCLEAAIRMYGDMPEGGHTSGELTPSAPKQLVDACERQPGQLYCVPSYMQDKCGVGGCSVTGETINTERLLDPEQP